MMKVSKRKTSTRKKRSDNKMKTVTDFKSKASEALQHKVWRSREHHQTIVVIEQLTSKYKLQNKVWDLGGNNYPDLRPSGHKCSYLGSLMQDHPAQYYHCILVEIGGLVFQGSQFPKYWIYVIT